MKTRLLFLLLVFQFPAFAGVFDCQWIFLDANSNAIPLKRVVIQPIAPYGVEAGSVIITGDRTTYTNDATGSLIVSNLFNGRSYRVQIVGPHLNTTITNSFDTNVTGLVNGADPLYLTAPISDGSAFGYSQSAANQRFHQVAGDNSTNAGFYGTLKIHGGATVGYVLTATNADGSAQWSASTGSGVSVAAGDNVTLTTNGTVVTINAEASGGTTNLVGASGLATVTTNGNNFIVNVPALNVWTSQVALGVITQNWTGTITGANFHGSSYAGGVYTGTSFDGLHIGSGAQLTSIPTNAWDATAFAWVAGLTGGGISAATASNIVAQNNALSATTATTAGNLSAGATVNPVNLGLATNVSGFKRYSVKTYGAAGDGVTDDSAAIQAAATVASATSAAAIGELFFPSGTYLLDTAGIHLNGAYGIDVPGTALDSGYWKILGQNTKIVSEVNTNAIQFVNGMRASAVQDLVLVGTNVNRSPLGNHVGFAFDGPGGQVRIQDLIAGQFTAGFVLDDMTGFEGVNLMAVSNFVGVGIGFKADGVKVNVRASGNQYGVFCHYTNTQFTTYTADGQPSFGGVIGQNQVGILVPFGYAHITKSYFENNVAAVQLGLSTNAYELSYPRLGTMPNVTITEGYGTSQGFHIWTNSTLRFENSGPLLLSKVYLFNSGADISTIESDVEMTVVKSDTTEITIGNGYRYVNGSRVPISGMSYTNLTDVAALTFGDRHSTTNYAVNTNVLVITGCPTNEFNTSWHWNAARQSFTNATYNTHAFTTFFGELYMTNAAHPDDSDFVFYGTTFDYDTGAAASWLDNGFGLTAMASIFDSRFPVYPADYNDASISTNKMDAVAYAAFIGGSGTTYTNNSGYAGRVVGSGIGTNVYANITNGFTGTGAIVLSNAPTLYNASLTGSNYMEDLIVTNFFTGLTNKHIITDSAGRLTNGFWKEMVSLNTLKLVNGAATPVLLNGSQTLPTPLFWDQAIFIPDGDCSFRFRVPHGFGYSNVVHTIYFAFTNSLSFTNSFYTPSYSATTGTRTLGSLNTLPGTHATSGLMSIRYTNSWSDDTNLRQTIFQVGDSTNSASRFIIGWDMQPY